MSGRKCTRYARYVISRYSCRMTRSAKKIAVGISSCLLGQNVRFDGGHKYHAWINKRLAEHFEFRPFCPEVAIGLGIPREPVRLVNTDRGTRVLGVKDPSLDVTDDLDGYGRTVAAQLDVVCGYIFKARSPSCGMERVRTRNEAGMPGRSAGVGAFAAAIMDACPNLPVEEEGRLNDPDLRDNFIERVFMRARWLQAMQAGMTPARLVDFHTCEKMAVMAHNQAAYRRLGQLVAGAGKRGFSNLVQDYEQQLMAAMKRHASRKSHANVLQHLQGYFSRYLPADDRAELKQLIDDYRLGLEPLAAPLALLRHHLSHHPHDWVQQQSYLRPYPRDLG